MPDKTLEKKLRWLDFETETPASGLLFTDKDYRKDSDVSFVEVLILNQAKNIGARAIYFRRFEGKSSVAQIFIFDNSDGSISLDVQIDIHRKLWSSGIVPLYYIFDETEVRIFNCRKSLKKYGKQLRPDPLDSLILTSKVHSIYSAHMFKNGSFWELPENKDHFKADSSSYQKLIEGLKKIRKEFSKNQDETVCNKLLVLSILVKYLEERKDSKGNRVLPARYFNKFNGAKSFCDVLRKNKGIELFKDLGQDINGKIFALDEQEEAEIAKLDQSQLADFLDARLDNYQYVFWRLYDFNYLPVELISRIYEEFIPTRKDIVYTPTHLVDFMVDECMPITKPKSNIKIIDVSCGSGIFMVAAFKRLVEWWQKEQYEKTGEIKSPNINKLKSILTKQIYGVDIEGEAVRLTIFSLAIAVCDMLDPTKMWEELTKEKLGDLSENVKEKDFFDFIKSGDKFDLIIGNPPFNPPVESKNEKEYWENLTKKVTFDFEIPDKNIALLFLQQAMKMLKPGGLLSFVIPSGPLLYNKTIGYRKNFLDKYNVPQIFDFSSLSGILLSSNYPVSVIFAENKTPDEKDILHAVVKRTKTSKEMLYFEIDKYDLHYVPKEIAKTEQLVWKANYLGGGHLFYLLKRTQGLRTIGDYLKKKKKNNGWFFGEGYQGFVESTEEPKKAPHLTNKRMITTERFIGDHINDEDIEKENNTQFHRTRERNKKIFKSPHILIKERPELPVAFRDDDLIFKNEILGIYAPEEQKQELIELRRRIIDNRILYKMLLLSASGRAGISRSVKTILKSDIMALPYPEDKDKLKLSRAEQIVCDYIIDYGIGQMASGEDSEACTREADDRALKAFAKVFCKSLNSIYKEGPKQFYPLEYIESDSFICFPFAYGNPDKPKIISRTKREKIERGNLESLLDHRQGKNVLYKRIIKLYGKDMVYLIKPKTLRYWLRSMALRDANEVFTDLVSSGY